MSEQTFKLTEVVNRLKRATVERKVLWERAGLTGSGYSALLEDGSHARLTCAASEAGPSSVQLSLTDGDAKETLRLDTSLVTHDLLRLALLQLFVSARDSLTDRAADAALETLRKL